MLILKKIKESKILRILLYRFIFLFNYFKINRVKLKDFNHIIVLGKGYSLNSLPVQINNIEKPNLIILSNFGNDDLKNTKLLNVIEKYPVLILGNITEPILDFKILKKLKLFRFYIQRIDLFSKNKTKIKTLLGPNLSKIYGPRKNFLYDAYTPRVYFLPDYTHFFLEKLRRKKIKFGFNTGLASIVLACTFKPKKVTMFGFDFYETNYFNADLLKKVGIKEFKMLKSSVSKFKYVFEEILKSHSKIQFSIFTKSKITFKKKNLMKIKL